MATITPVALPIPDWLALQGVAIWQWTSVGNADTCSPVDLGAHADRSFQVTGTFDGATVAAVGTNAVGVAEAPLTDPQGNDIAIGSYPGGYSSKIEAISEATRFIRPVVSGGTAPSMTITLLVRK